MKLKVKIDFSLFLIVFLIVSLAITTLALVYSEISLVDNTFHTATVRLRLYNENGEELDSRIPELKNNRIVVQPSLYEPGATIRSSFNIKNFSSADIYYRMYFENVSGGLEDVVDVKIYELLDNGQKTLLMDSKAVNITKDSFKPLTWLKTDNSIYEQKNYEMLLHFPEDAGNEYMNKSFNFSFAVEATQKRNNPEMKF